MLLWHRIFFWGGRKKKKPLNFVEVDTADHPGQDLTVKGKFVSKGRAQGYRSQTKHKDMGDHKEV